MEDRVGENKGIEQEAQVETMNKSELGSNQLQELNPEFEGESEEEEGFENIPDQFGSDSAQQEDYYATNSDDYSGTETMTWITWFCSLLGNEYFCEVAPEFIEDDFNLYGLRQVVPFYEDALSTILDQEPLDEQDRSLDNSAVESSAEVLYGLIHQRYINTRAGMNDMANKFAAGHFGTCPRVFCDLTPVLPVGRSDIAGLETVKLFCPSCLDLYSPASSRYQGIDGAFFGTTFPHLFMDSFPDLIRGHTPLRPLNIYTERIFGFKVSEKAHSGPRMKWLRTFPVSDVEDNDDENNESDDFEMDQDLDENGEAENNPAGSSEMAISSNTISQSTKDV